MQSALSCFFPCWGAPTVSDASPPRANLLQLVPVTQRPAPDQANLNPYLAQAGIEISLEFLLLVRRGSSPEREIHAFLGCCGRGASPWQVAVDLIDSGVDRDAFRGALNLMKVGLIDARIPNHVQHPGEDWLNHLARHGREPAAEYLNGRRTITMAEREAAIVYQNLARLRPPEEASGTRSQLFSAAQAVNREAYNRLAQEIRRKGGSRPSDRLHRVAKEGDAGAVRQMLRRGANPNRADGDGHTALHYACANGHLAVISTLLEFNAAPDVQDGFYATPVHIAARHGQPGAIQLLAAHGADLNAVDDHGDTPLHFAVWEGSALSIRALMHVGADVSVPNIQNETPAQMAHRLGRHRLVAILYDQG